MTIRMHFPNALDSPTGEADVRTAEHHLARVAKRAAVAGVTPHVIRHTMATHLLRRVSLVVASRMLGHKQVSTTEQEYGHLLVDDLMPAAHALNAVLGSRRK